METKINIAELLKDCPKGMELDCTMYNNCTFERIDDVGYIEILIRTPSGRIRLTKEGCIIHNDKYAKCVIFPKGKTTWEGFHRPFKDGDVLITDSDALCIYKSIHKTYKSNDLIDFYCGYRPNDNQLVLKDKKDTHFGLISEAKLATEEEKKKLFDAIKSNGYKWNAEKKELEKLIEPKFKVGDKIQDKDSEIWHKVIKIFEDCYLVESYLDEQDTIGFDIQDNYELISNKFDITTLKPFESHVLVRDYEYERWIPAIWGYYRIEHEKNYPYGIIGGIWFRQCIPYEGNQHLLGKTDDCDEYYKTWEE